MVDGTKIQKMSVSHCQKVYKWLMGQRYKKCPFLKILSALIMKSIIGVCQFSFQNPSFLIEFLPLVLRCFSINNIDKNLSGKSDEREVKICKNRLFTLHSSFFIL